MSLVLVLVLGVVASLFVGRLLQNAGRPLLDDVLDDTRTSDTVARLLSVLFALVAIGVTLLVATAPVDPADDVVTATVTKLGLVLLVIGAVHGLTLLALLQIRRRRRQARVEEEMADRMAQQRREGRPGPG